MGVQPWELLELPVFWRETHRAFRAAETTAAINAANRR